MIHIKKLSRKCFSRPMMKSPFIRVAYLKCATGLCIFVVILVCHFLLDADRILGVERTRQLAVKRLVPFNQNIICVRDCHRESLYAERRKTISNTCEAYNNLTEPKYAYYTEIPTIILGNEHQFVYCAVTKSGSSFWKVALAILEYGRDEKLPRLNEYLTNHSHREMEQYFETAIQFQFVREPYGRLFSAYNDKLFRPNAAFWRKSAGPMIKYVRPNASRDSLEFGHDITFTEFIQFLIKKMKTHKTRLNEHFAPMYSVCNPCVRKQLYLGKLETFVEDAKFIISKIMNSSDYDGVLEQDVIKSITQEVKDRTKYLYQLLEKTKELKYPKRNLFLRHWRDFQIRGLLSKAEDMPLNENDVESVSQKTFENILKAAVTKPANQTLVKMQRREAMLQAYSAVPRDLLDDLAKYVEIDCALFGYDNRPSCLFEASGAVQNTFNYFDAL